MNEIALPLPLQLASKIKFPKCPHCKRRQGMQPIPGQFIEAQNPDGTITKHPKYEVLPCCSATYLKTNKGPNRKERIHNEAVATGFKQMRADLKEAQ